MGGLSAVAFLVGCAGAPAPGTPRLIEEMCSAIDPVVLFALPPVELDPTENKPGFRALATLPAASCPGARIIGRAPEEPGLRGLFGNDHYGPPWWFRIAAELEGQTLEGWVQLPQGTCSTNESCGWQFNDWQRTILALPVTPLAPLATEGLPDLTFGSIGQGAEVGQPCVAGTGGFDFEVLNDGQAATPSSLGVTMTWASEEAEIAEGPTDVWELWRGLEPGEAVTRHAESEVLVILDPAGSITEEDETNNRLRTTETGLVCLPR